MTRIRAVLTSLLLLASGTAALVVAAEQKPPDVRVAVHHAPFVSIYPEVSGVDILPTCAATPSIDLDPGLGVSGPEVSTVQVLLQIPQDGVYGVQTAQAVSGVVCPDLGLYAALQALSEATPALRDQATARIASRPPVAAVTVNPVVTPPSGDCGGVNQYAAYIYQHESGCNPASVNSAGCRGLGQACPGSKLPCGDNFACQDAWFTEYASRYGGWAGAYQFWTSHNWW